MDEGVTGEALSGYYQRMLLKWRGKLVQEVIKDGFFFYNDYRLDIMMQCNRLMNICRQYARSLQTTCPLTSPNKLHTQLTTNKIFTTGHLQMHSH